MNTLFIYDVNELTIDKIDDVMAVMMNSMQRKYVPNVTQQIATAEANYLRLIKLVGNWDDFSAASIHWQTEDLCGEEYLHLAITERFNYTLTLQVDFYSPRPWCSCDFAVRVYQDMRMAEVVKSDNGKQYQGSYGYPNSKGLMPDEKAQLNFILKSLLQRAKSQGLVINKSHTNKANIAVVEG